MPEDLVKSTPSKKFAANVMATGALLAIVASPIAGVPIEVAQDGMYYLMTISLFFNGAKGVQDWQRAKGGK